MGKMIETYLEQREQLRAVVSLGDYAMHHPKKIFKCMNF